jgi:hypothetical protein
MKIMSKEEKRARIARVQSRGLIIDATTVDNLPQHLHGEWVHRSDIDITRMQAMGFWIDEEYAPNRSMHSDGSKNKGIVGDTVFMVTTRENKELIDEVRQEEYQKMHGIAKADGSIVDQREEREYKNSVERSGLPTPVIEESHTREIQKDELRTILAGDKK